MLYNIVKNIVKVFYRLRFKINVIGAENVPNDGPVLLTSNHTSLYDPPLVAAFTKREMSFFAKSELFKYPMFGKFITNLNAIAVNRGKGDRAALKVSVDAVKNGKMLLIFPEGGRNLSGKLKPLQEGASFIAMKSNAQIVPVAIKGSYNRKEGITLIYGKPIDVNALIEEGKKRKEITAILEERLRNMLKTPLILDKRDKI
ncbi:lysophospholipid acyltransferase family protein [Phocicoccus pinnipedialis]|uniref:1-acyl-sn-glycerol-3-phosphate acyltransferase n=1 Tax=Phocicoccus pinnipedialis TaxID=110845 RepID=A0A6V7RFJ9_9BACL|nr:lysophospholipid acyltransferase family protein [Jeotgalicoccus pinnipedialis]MBP1939357.1 1-acyl-sn-glycerol-3-phosphate acyltransferase [Jeotgalicoccus pinnipedialis]CAD2075711.1 1-acyl-sn-glycerol-3-phosphate acyltransferase [Jeotgalicoccus pinnipedialis]